MRRPWGPISSMKIEDNYLDNDDLLLILDTVSGETFPWFYQAFPERSDDKDILLCHDFYRHDIPPYCEGEGMKLLEPLLNKIMPTALIRIKANSYPNTHIIKEHKMHTDMSYGMTSIYYLNTNNGYTQFGDGTIVESMQNRLLTFQTDISPHCSTSCTDARMRLNININYYG